MTRTLAADDYAAIRAAQKELFSQPQSQEQPEYGRSVPEQRKRMELPVSEGGVELTTDERRAVASMYHCNNTLCGWHKSKRCLLAGHCV